MNAAWAYQYSSQHTSIYILFLSYWFTLDVYICLILFDIIFSIMRYWHEIWVQYKHLLLFLLQWLCRVVFWWCCNTGNYILYHHYCISLYIIPILFIILVFSYFDEKELIVAISRFCTTSLLILTNKTVMFQRNSIQKGSTTTQYHIILVFVYKPAEWTENINQAWKRCLHANLI